MDTALILNAMRDPAGVPAHPLVFQALAVFTWIFHIAFVHLTLGTATLAIVAFFRRDDGPHWARLSRAMTQVAKVGVSLLVVLGVAPLLFMQVIYDPQWYTANVLSARWALAFIITLLIGYCLWFFFYWRNHEGAVPRHLGGLAIVALLLFLLDGLIMHVLSYQSLLPDQWMQWYAPGGVVDTSGSHLHAIQWPRLAFILSLSVPALGLFLQGYADYFSVRRDYPQDYLGFARRLGHRLAVAGLLLSLPLLAAWIAVLPLSLGLRLHPVALALAVSLAGLTVWALRRGGRVGAGYPLIAGGLGVLSLLAVWREVVRMAYLRPHGYDIANYPMHIDWPSIVLFALTLVGVGGSFGGFCVAAVYRAGRVQGVYTAGPGLARLGTASVAILAFWILSFFVYGIYVWLRQAF